MIKYRKFKETVLKMLKKIFVFLFCVAALFLTACKEPAGPVYPPLSFEEIPEATLPDDRTFIGDSVSFVGELAFVSTYYDLYVYRSPVEVYEDPNGEPYEMYSFPVDLDPQECEKHHGDVRVFGVLYMGEHGVSLKDCVIEECNCLDHDPEAH